MFTILEIITENYKIIIIIGVLVVLLSMSGNITTTIRGARRGLAQAVTPLGFFIFLILVYFAYKFYLDIVATL